MTDCGCSQSHVSRRIVLTGGPGAGKTAVLELVRHTLCRHVEILPEAAGIVFGGGFPREEADQARQAEQRAIFHVQRELEVLGDVHNAAIVLCDRGSVDGVAYWPGTPNSFWTSLNTTLDFEMSRYAAVLHLRTPTPSQGYNQQNPLRIETPTSAAQVDQRILEAWRHHPRRHVIEATPDFLEKARAAVAFLRAELPSCCADHLPQP